MIKFLVDGLERCEVCLIPLEKGYEFIERQHLICIWLMSQQHIILPDVMSEGLRLTPLSNFISIDEINKNSKYRLKNVANRAFPIINEDVFTGRRSQNTGQLEALMKARRRAEAQNIKFYEIIGRWIKEGKSAPTRKKFNWKFFKVKKGDKKKVRFKLDKYVDTDSIFSRALKEERGMKFNRDKPNPRTKKIKRANLYSKLLNIRPITDVDKELKKDKVLYKRG